MLFVRCYVQTGFSPAELVFGHMRRGPLKALKDKFLTTEESPQKNVLNHVSSFRERLHHARVFAREALAQSQSEMKRKYDRSAADRHFSVGDKVLVLLLISGSALSVRFTGPYSIHQKLSNTDYVLNTPDQR